MRTSCATTSPAWISGSTRPRTRPTPTWSPAASIWATPIRWRSWKASSTPTPARASSSWVPTTTYPSGTATAPGSLCARAEQRVHHVNHRHAGGRARREAGERRLGVVGQHRVEGAQPMRPGEDACERCVGEGLAGARAGAQRARREDARNAHDLRVVVGFADTAAVAEERRVDARGAQGPDLVAREDLGALGKRKGKGAEDGETLGCAARHRRVRWPSRAVGGAACGSAWRARRARAASPAGSRPSGGRSAGAGG